MLPQDVGCTTYYKKRVARRLQRERQLRSQLTFQPLGIAGDPYVIPAVVVTKTETHRQATMQVGTRSRFKRSLDQINPPQLEEAKKPKHDEQQKSKRYVNRILQKLATARSQTKKTSSQRDKKANQRKQKNNTCHLCTVPSNQNRHEFQGAGEGSR